MSETIGERTSSGPQGANVNPWDSLSENQSKTFQVAPGTTKEAEFKRITGEDWPGDKYYAETSGADDDGYDYPIETWTIHERPEEISAEFDGATFQVAPGTTKEAEFKRITGEDWPGDKYYAETSGADDDGYDYPIETWTIHAHANSKTNDKATSSPISSYHIPTAPELEKPQSRPSKRTTEQDRQAMIIDAKSTRTEDYLKSKYGQEEQRLEAELDKITESFEFLESKGYLTAAEKNERLDQAMSDTLKKIDAVRADYEAAKRKEFFSRIAYVAKAVEEREAAKADKTPTSTPKTPETAAKAPAAKAPEDPAAKRAKYAADINDADHKISDIDKKLAYLRQYQAISAEIADIDKKITNLSKTQSESKSKLQPEWQELVEHIKVLPDQGLKFIMAPNSVSDPDKSSEYQAWWDHQDDGTKRKSFILARYLYSNKAWESAGRGKGFINWLRRINPGVFK